MVATKPEISNQTGWLAPNIWFQPNSLVWSMPLRCPVFTRCQVILPKISDNPRKRRFLKNKDKIKEVGQVLYCLINPGFNQLSMIFVNLTVFSGTLLIFLQNQLTKGENWTTYHEAG
jgi:hypothetical protein